MKADDISDELINAVFDELRRRLECGVTHEQSEWGGGYDNAMRDAMGYAEAARASLLAAALALDW